MLIKFIKKNKKNNKKLPDTGRVTNISFEKKTNFYYTVDTREFGLIDLCVCVRCHPWLCHPVSFVFFVFLF